MTPSGDTQDRAGAEAAYWLIALEDDPDSTDLRARFEVWRNADPANAAAWRDTADIYRMVGKTAPAHRMHWAGHAQSIGPLNIPRHMWLPSWPVMLSMAAAACLAVFVMPTVLLHLRADYETVRGEVRHIQLADGSRVDLAPDSIINVAFQPGERRVRLLKGEAYFTVVHDAARPFRVQAANLRATDVGTAFDVRLTDDATDLAVQEGRVRVEDTAARISEDLEAGQSVRIGEDGRAHRGNKAPEMIAAWRNGQIVAQDRPMADVIDELRRSYAGMILVADGGFAREQVTGVYNTADPVAALRAIAGAHGGVVYRLSPWLLVVSRG